MHDQEIKGVITVCLLAAFADGNKADTEREEIRRIVESLGGATGPAVLCGRADDGHGGVTRFV